MTSGVTNGVWDYIFRDGPFLDTTIPKKHLDHLKSDFGYFHPFGIRSPCADERPFDVEREEYGQERGQLVNNEGQFEEKNTNVSVLRSHALVVRG